MEQFLDILKEWGSLGFSVWSIVLFFQVRKLKKARVIADTQKVWQEIAESNNQTLLDQNEKIRRLSELVARLEGMFYRVYACKFYDHCPLSNELQKYKANNAVAYTRQPGKSYQAHRKARDHPTVESGCETDDDRPP